jgi:hypothetical protein
MGPRGMRGQCKGYHAVKSGRGEVGSGEGGVKDQRQSPGFGPAEVGASLCAANENVTIRRRMEIYSPVLQSWLGMSRFSRTACHGTHEQSRYKRTAYRLDFATVPVTAAVHLSLTAGASDSSFCTACPIATYSSSIGAFARRARLDSERRHSLTPRLKGTLLQPLGRQTPTTLVCVCVGGTCLWQQQGAAHLG